MVIKSPKNKDKCDVTPLIRGAEWIGVLKAFWTTMSSTLRNKGQDNKIDNE